MFRCYLICWLTLSLAALSWKCDADALDGTGDKHETNYAVVSANAEMADAVVTNGAGLG